MSAGTAAAVAALRLLESEGSAVVARAQARVARRPGVPARQRGRTGNASAAGDFNAKHVRQPKGRVGGGEFAPKTAAEKQQNEQAQQQLQRQGLYKGAIDGAAGPQTQAALRQFQQQNGIAPTGKLDAATKATLAAPPPKSRASVIADERKLLATKTPASKTAKTGRTRAAKMSGGGTSGGRATAGGGTAGVDASSPASVKAFQKKQGLTVDGVIGPQTQAKMREVASQTPAARATAPKARASLPNGVLRQGTGMDRKRGNGDVKQVQTALQNLGYDVGDAGTDGKFGPATERAIRQFQQENGLIADGVFGRHTRRLLDLSNARGMTAPSKQHAPLSADQQPLSGKPGRQRAGTAVSEATLLLLEAPGVEPPTQAERDELHERHGDVANGVSLKRDGDGLFVHTHRARSKSFRTVAAIPKTVVRFIESTG